MLVDFGGFVDVVRFGVGHAGRGAVVNPDEERVGVVFHGRLVGLVWGCHGDLRTLPVVPFLVMEAVSTGTLKVLVDLLEEVGAGQDGTSAAKDVCRMWVGVAAGMGWVAMLVSCPVGAEGCMRDMVGKGPEMLDPGPEDPPVAALGHMVLGLCGVGPEEELQNEVHDATYAGNNQGYFLRDCQD